MHPYARTSGALIGFLFSVLFLLTILIPDPVLATDPPASPEPSPWSTPRPPLWPCEWYPVDVNDPHGEWWQPLTDDTCDTSETSSAVSPRMTLPPTDTE